MDKSSTLMNYRAVKNRKVFYVQQFIGFGLINTIVHYFRQSIMCFTIGCSLIVADAQAAYTPFDGETVVVTNGGSYAVSANTSVTFIQNDTSVSANISLDSKSRITLRGVNIRSFEEKSRVCPAIDCRGDATIILADETSNSLYGMYGYYSRYVSPAISVPAGVTLTIKGENEGTGSLYACGGTNGNLVAPGIGVGRASGLSGNSKSFGEVNIASGIVSGGGSQMVGPSGLAIGLGREDGGDLQSTGGRVTILDSITSAKVEFWGVNDTSITIGNHLKRKTVSGYRLNTFTPITYSVTFDANGGEGDSSRKVAYGRVLGMLPEPALTSYVFTGWYTAKDGGTQISASTEVVGDVTYYAHWVRDLCEPEFVPVSGTTFDSPLSVSMLCPTEGATIHYTTDGSDPTAESAVYKRFWIYGKTTVKAVAEKDGMLSEVVTAEYALGQCANPVISLADGAEFAHSNQEVSIAWNNDGVLRYTLDGSEPTAESPIYEGPFSFSESVEVKAKVFSDDFFDSSVVTSSLTRVWVNVTTPVVDAASSFTGSKTKVSISCATEGAVVRYTLNGNEPNSHSTKYTGPFYVTDSCTVKVYAVMPDYLNSEVATFAIEKVWGIGDTMGKPDHEFVTEGDGGAGWTRVVDATAPNGEAMKSGAIMHEQSSILSTTVMGPGTLTFSWRTSCEEDELHEWDHAEFAVDGDVLLYCHGVNSWHQESVRIEGSGEHAVSWTYKKDDVESAGDDAAWVAGYVWKSDYIETQTTEVPIPYAWLLDKDPDVVDEYDSYEAAAKRTGANGHKVWESYVVGADPNNKNDALRITAFPMNADGTPDLPNLAIAPEQSKWNVPNARLVIKGKPSLAGPFDWQLVTDENKADMRFFRVEVVLP